MLSVKNALLISVAGIETLCNKTNLMKRNNHYKVNFFKRFTSAESEFLQNKMMNEKNNEVRCSDSRHFLK